MIFLPDRSHGPSTCLRRSASAARPLQRDVRQPGCDARSRVRRPPLPETKKHAQTRQRTLCSSPSRHAVPVPRTRRLSPDRSFAGLEICVSSIDEHMLDQNHDEEQGRERMRQDECQAVQTNHRPQRTNSSPSHGVAALSAIPRRGSPSPVDQHLSDAGEQNVHDNGRHRPPTSFQTGGGSRDASPSRDPSPDPSRRSGVCLQSAFAPKLSPPDAAPTSHFVGERRRKRSLRELGDVPVSEKQPHPRVHVTTSRNCGLPRFREEPKAVGTWQAVCRNVRRRAAVRCSLLSNRT